MKKISSIVSLYEIFFGEKFLIHALRSAAYHTYHFKTP